MARQARESAVAIPKTRGTVQVPGLMTHIPGIGPISVVIQIACLAVARSAKSTDLNSRKPSRILNRPSAGRFGMRATGPMARFTVNAGLARLHVEVGTESHRSGRVTTETTKRRLHRVERLVHRVRVTCMTRS